MTPEEWQFLTQQGNHVPNPVQPLTEEQASVAKIPLYMTPIVGQGLAGYDAYHSASQGNYGTAAAEAAMGFLPVHKPVLAALNAIKRNALPVAAAGAVTALPTDAEAAPSYNGIEGLYSRMAEAVKGWSGKNTGANWLGRLKNEPGVPGAELKWSPARKWLETSGEKPITAEELRAYIDSNPIPITQGTLRAKQGNVHYGSYSLPGEVRGYEEKMFHFDPNAPHPDEASAIAALRERGVRDPENVIANSRLFGIEAEGWDDTFGPGTLDIIKKGVAVQPYKRPINYHAPHFPGDETNLAGHTRTNIRDLPNGEKAYHVEEIQSDWAQRGRDKGFHDPEKPYVVWSVNEEGKKIRLSAHADKEEAIRVSHSLPEAQRGITNTGTDARPILMQPLAEEQKGLPLYGSMAFRKNLYDAAKADADHMTWTTGRQQADRYPDEENVAGMIQFYDRKMRKIAEIEAKRLGIKPEEHLGQQSFGGEEMSMDQFRKQSGQALERWEEQARIYSEDADDLAYHMERAADARRTLEDMTPHEGLQYLETEGFIMPEDMPKLGGGTVHSFRLTPELRKQILEKGLPFMGIGAGAKILNERGAAPAPLDNAMPPGA